MDAATMRAARERKIRAAQEAHIGHDGCDLGMLDPDMGLVCGCGVVLGDLRAPEENDASLPAVPGMVVAPYAGEVTAAGGIASEISPADPVLSKLDIIDATHPYSPADVEQHLLEAVGRLERGAHYERVCGEDYAQICLEYEKAYARAFVKAKDRGGSDKLAEQRARLDVEEIAGRRMIAKMKLEAVKGTMHSLRSVISSYQSVAKSIATAYMAGGGGRSGT